METTNIKNYKNYHVYSKCVELQEATSVISAVISRYNDEYQHHISYSLNDPMTNVKIKTIYINKKWHSLVLL